VKKFAPLAILSLLLAVILAPHGTSAQIGLPIGQGKGGGGSPSAALKANAGWLFVTDYGAKCNDVADDTAAINAGEAARNSIGGTLFFPPGVCLISSELAPNPGYHWEGAAEYQGQSVLRANAAIRSVVLSRGTPDAVIGSKGFELNHLTLDANNQATYALFRYSDWKGKYTHSFFINGKLDDIHASSKFLPYTQSAINTAGVTGGSPPGLVVTEPDPTYGGLFGTTSLAVKIIVGGALGTATYAMSTDNGVTYATATQSVVGTSNLLSATSTYTNTTGLTLTWPAGVYVAGDFWKWTETVVSPSGEGPTPVNVEARFEDISADNAGTIFATAGLVVTYAGILTATATTLPGTVTITAGSQTIVGAGGMNFLTTGARTGDMLFVPGGGIFQIAGVADATHVMIPAVAATNNLFSGAGLGIGIGVGASYWLDDKIEGDNVRNVIDRAFFNHAPQYVRITASSDGLDRIRDTRFDTFYAFTAAQVGGALAASSMLFDACEFKNSPVSTTAGATPMYLSFGSNGTVFEPRQNFTAIGPGGGLNIMNGILAPIGVGNTAATLVPLLTETLTDSAITLSTGSEVIQSPTYQDPNGQPAIVRLNVTTPNLLMTSAPFITAWNKPFGEAFITLINTGTHCVILQDDFVSASKLFLEAPRATLCRGESIKLYSKIFDNKWYQIGGISHSYTTEGGSQSYVGGVAITTNATPTEIYRLDASGLIPGAALRADLQVTDTNGNDCFIEDIFTAWSDSGANMGSTVGNLLTTAGGGVCPFGWTWSVTTSGGNGHLNVIGDGAHTVFWRANVHISTAPRSD
jgi:hypothetical protein